MGIPSQPPSGVFHKLLWAILLVTCLAYANHFENSFQFDDEHTVVNNPWIRDLRNIPRFFRDAGTFSTFHPNREYRPLVTTSLAVDYWLGGSAKSLQPDPQWFHISTFVWFLIQLSVMAALFRRCLEGIGSQWIALAATAVYAVHPAIAETVNYVIQRADLYDTLGVLAGILIYTRIRGRFGLYLVPVVAALLSKPPALVFPVLLLLWLVWFEDIPLLGALKSIWPAFLVTGSVVWFVTFMTPGGHSDHMIAAGPYVAAQPAVLLHYFGQFFLPIHLSGDSDRAPFPNLLAPEPLAGILFVVFLIVAIIWCSRRRQFRPVAFGLAWFLVASLPTSIYPLAEVENDHRMFFPFVGLTLAVCTVLARIPFSRIPVLALRRALPATLGLAAVAGLAWGTTERNRVWKTGESFWSDVTRKSPRNGRGWTALGRILIIRQDYAGALTDLERASALLPDYYPVEINLGLVWSALGDDTVAEQHYRRAIELAPAMPEPRTTYADWLREKGREKEAIAQLSVALRENPENLKAHYVLMFSFDKTGDAKGLREAALDTLSVAPSDVFAKQQLERSQLMLKKQTELTTGSGDAGGAATLVDDAMRFALRGEWAKCVDSARRAIELRHDFAMAWNNLATCQNGLRHFGEAGQSAREALRIDPALGLARKNLEFALAEGKVPGLNGK